MRKELSPIHALQSCEICDRTILKGERTEPYLAPDGSRRLVCELCLRRAQTAGWIRESAHDDMPAATPRLEPRPSLIDRFRRWRGENGAPQAVPEEAEYYDYDQAPVEERYDVEEPVYAEEQVAVEEQAPVEGQLPDDKPPVDERFAVEEEPRVEAEQRYEGPEPAPPARVRGPASSPRDPRHVRAVPTNSQVKVERALELFNSSEYRRTVAGLVRTLGDPWVTALPVPDSPSEVIVVVAWELSWYQYRIDLGDSGESVFLTDKGQEIDELEEHLRNWNGSADSDGALASAIS